MPLSQQEFEGLLSENVLLAPMTTLEIGGPARYFAEVTSTDALLAGVEWARSRNRALFVLGGGSNVVVADAGFSGLVLRVSLRGVETRVKGNHVLVTAAAGEEWDPLVSHCVDRNWGGLECLSGIPGRVGATPIQNVGAYGQETADTLVSIEALDLAKGRLIELSANDCGFSYRNSRFKARDRDRFIITRVVYRLAIDGKPVVRYAELQRYLAEREITRPSLADVRGAVLAIRRLKAMVIDTTDPDSRSVGSFFVNPTVTRAEFESIRRSLAAAGSASEEPPAFPTSDGRVKLSAAWLIEQAGIGRGFTYGKVGTSTKHALAIINRGGGTASEIIALKELIQTRVLGAFGVALIPEPVFVGFGE